MYRGRISYDVYIAMRYSLKKYTHIPYELLNKNITGTLNKLRSTTPYLARRSSHPSLEDPYFQ